MHDVRFIRENPKEFDKALGRRGINAASKEILKIDTKDYYYSNVIARASKTMSECKLAKINFKSTGTEG